MTTGGDFVTTEEAAALLGVTTRRVQQMLDEGSLTKVARGLVDATSVDRYQASAQGGRTRVWAEHTAWAAIALLSGVAPDWLGAAQVSRLRGALRETDVQSLVARTRARAVVHTYSAHPAATSRFADDLVITDSSALGLVADGAGRVSGYYAASHLDEAVRAFGLEEATTGTLTVRATGFDLAVVRDLASTDVPVLTALDATTSLDPRERGRGVEALQVALDGYPR